MRVRLADLAGGAQLILDSFAAQLIEQGVTIPGVQYVAPGSGAQAPAWDGEQFTVSLAGIGQGQPGITVGQTMYPAATVTWSQWAIVLLRIIPSLEDHGPGVWVPSADLLGDAGSINLDDVAQLVRAAIALHGQYAIQPSGTGFSIDSCVPLGPMGGLAGARLLISVSLT